MRSEEILQLRASGFKTDDDGVWYIDIHRRDGSKLKNAGFIGTVPGHPIIDRLNLRSLVEAAGNHPDGYLMFHLKPGSEGRFTTVFSRRFRGTWNA